MADKHMSLRAIAIASAGACALTSGLSFTATSQPLGQREAVKGLRGAQSSTTSKGSGAILPTLAGAGVVTAGLVRSSRVGRRAEKAFAGGLTGSKLHGWGEYKFDPLNLAENYPENLPWFREAELKHGRVAMLAWLGFIVPEAVRIPIDPLTDTSLDVVNAHNKLIGPGLGEGPMWWLMVAVGAIESVRFKQLGLGFENLTIENAGDLGLRGFAPSSAEGMENMRTKELKNGRLAMLAVGGCLTQAVAFNAPHFPFVPTAQGSTTSKGSGAILPPLAGAGVVTAGLVRSSRVGRRAEKAFAGGLTGSKLHGWGEYKFDPLNLAENYPENLPWFREAELKHGRVAMLAWLGFIVPEAVRIPIDPLTDTSLDVVNAHNKLIGPGLGEGPMWWLMVAVGAIESVRFKQLGLGFENLTIENAGDLGLRGFAPSSAEGMENMRTKELKNGRLAMLAVGGCLTQAVAFNAPHFPFVPTA